MTFGKCFLGTGVSSTFELAPEWLDWSGNPSVWILTYGSGDIEAVDATDVVTVGNETIAMNSSLLLMVAQTLGFDFQFEGILGLGLNSLKSADGVFDPPSFIAQAGVRRFSMCFNLNGEGALRLNTEEQPKYMGVNSSYHWTLGMDGLSLEDSDGFEQISACRTEAGSHAGNGCSAIFDSGTTLLTGPESSLLGIFAKACQKWKRCADLHANVSYMIEVRMTARSSHRELYGHSAPRLGPVQQSTSPETADLVSRMADAYEKHLSAQNSTHGSRAQELRAAPALHEVFMVILQACNSWYSEETNLDVEMPLLHFHIVGAQGKKDVISIKPTSYIAETTAEVWAWTKINLVGVLPIWWPGQETEYVCTPLFGSAGSTEADQEAWILGTPIYYDYQVHHDLGKGSEPPGLAFEKDSCGACSTAGSPYSTDSSSVALVGGSAGHTGLRLLRHVPRMPTIGMLESLRPQV